MKSNLLERLESGVLIGDGAMGTLLYERGLPIDRSCEELVLTQADSVRQIHQDYVAAGAQVVETNSFGANRLKLFRRGLEGQVNEINQKAAQIARSVIGKAEIFLAGSVGPLGIPWDEAKAQGIDAQTIFKEQISALYEGGVDFILFETFSNLEELKVALAIAQKIKKSGTYLCSMSFTEDGRTHCGVSMADVFTALKNAGADVLGANCCVGPRALASLFKQLGPHPDRIYAAAPNAGRPEFLDGRYYYLTTPQYFAEQGLELVRNGVRLVGGCCGTKPDHIVALKKALQDANLQSPTETKINISFQDEKFSQSTLIEATTPHSALRTPHSDLPTLLDVIKQQTLIVTEFDSPKSLILDKMLQAARFLKEAGTDFLTVADNSLAILRMNCVAASHLVQKETGLRTIVHLACRDRNLIGTQSELMGMDALGLNHVLALTGDPSKVGDSPGATSVYDLNSISLLEGIRSMNSGRSFGGRDLKKTARFVAGCSFNPNVKNLDVQVKRLERKIAAGAQFVMTQPIFDPALAKMVHDATASFKIPILLGVLPLLNGRNSEFLHNEVPGIVIPDRIRERMRGKEGEDGFKEGLAVAREIAKEVLSYFRGIYLITPIIHYRATVELSRAIRSGEL